VFGKSKYGIGRLHAGALDLLTIAFLLHYGKKPSRMFGVPGIILGMIGVIICGYLSMLWFLGQGPIGTRPLLALGILLILVGVQFVALGLLSELQSLSFHRSEKPYSIAMVLRKDKGA
jgi:dolichol-phosphate mannosyltransferase